MLILWEGIQGPDWTQGFPRTLLPPSLWCSPSFLLVPSIPSVLGIMMKPLFFLKVEGQVWLGRSSLGARQINHRHSSNNVSGSSYHTTKRVLQESLLVSIYPKVIKVILFRNWAHAAFPPEGLASFYPTGNCFPEDQVCINVYRLSYLHSE